METEKKIERFKTLVRNGTKTFEQYVDPENKVPINELILELETLESVVEDRLDELEGIYMSPPTYREFHNSIAVKADELLERIQKYLEKRGQRKPLWLRTDELS
jgi:hypothetical protein